MSTTRSASKKKNTIQTATRNSIEEADLRKRLLENQKNQSEVAKHSSPVRQTYKKDLFTLEKISKYKKEFQTYRIFLYKLDRATETIISQQLVSLGAKRAAFFSALEEECTHVITTREIKNNYDLMNDTQKSPSKDTFSKDDTDNVLRNAKAWKKPVWTIEYVRDVLKQLINYNTLKSRVHKRSKQTESTFYEFPGYFLMISDTSGKHCPVNIKEYSVDQFDVENKLRLPWPTLDPKADERRQMIPSDVLKEIEKLDEDCLYSDEKTNPFDQLDKSNTEETIVNLQTKDVEAQAVENKISKKRENDQSSEKEQKKRAGYCEICKKKLPDIKAHLKTSEHLENYNANDFSELDSLLSSLRRKYSSPLPSYMKTNVNPTIDGPDVQFYP